MLDFRAWKTLNLAPGKPWVCCLTQGDIEHLWPLREGILPPEEWAHAQSMASEERKSQFIWGRVLLRNLLSFVLKKPPADIEITFQSGGKPVLAHILADGAAHVHFNLSHTASWVGCVLSTEPCGIDMQILRLQPFPSLRERFFSLEERDYMGEDPVKFTQLWCKKEAFIKALGVPWFTYAPIVDTLKSQNFFNETIQRKTFCFEYAFPGTVCCAVFTERRREAVFPKPQNIGFKDIKRML